MDSSSAAAMRRSDQPRIRAPQIRSTTWSSCSLTSSRTRLRAATRPARVLIFRRLGMTPDMLQTRADQVPLPAVDCSPFLAPIGRDPPAADPGRASLTSKIDLFTWSTSSSADHRKCIKSAIGELSRFRSGSGFANPRKQTKPPTGSGSGSSPFSFPRAPDPYGAHKTGCARLGKPPRPAGELPERRRRPRAYALPWPSRDRPVQAL